VLIENGGQATGSAFVGYYSPGASSGALTLTGSGTVWNGVVSAGYYGTGSFSLGNGATVTNGGGLMGSESGSNGSATVSGVGSVWGSANSSGTLHVGYKGTASLVVENGGIVNNALTYIASSAGSQGDVTVTGVGSQWNNGGTGLSVGGSGIGTMTISAGGKVNTTTSGGSGNFIGQNSGGQGAVTITGAGSKWTTNTYLTVGNSGVGDLLIENGGEYASGNNGMSIGSNSSGSGKVTVTGTNSKWTSSQGVSIGSSGSGELNIAAGGSVSVSSGIIAHGAGSTGKVEVTGSGSVWNTSLGIDIGRSGSGVLTISGGGTVNTNNLSGADAFAPHIGFADGSQGTVTVTGSGSLWDIDAALVLGGISLTTDTTATGVLNIADGGRVNAYGTVKLWDSGTINLEVGNNSLLQVNGSGGIGSGTLSNDGLIRLSAAPTASAGVYTPISAGSWSGAGLYAALGGVWNNSTHEFTVSTVQQSSAGSEATIDLSTSQRILVDSGTSVVSIAFSPDGQASGGGSTISFQASLNNTSQIQGTQVLSAWDFVTDLSTGTPVQLSLDIGTGWDPNLLMVWHSDDGGLTWNAYDTGILYDQSTASFTVTGFSSYAVAAVPEPSTWVLLALAGLGMWGLRRHKSAS